MAVFGVDIASYQSGLDIGRVRREGFEFVIAKATQGSGYVNPEYHKFRDQARAEGLRFAAYHYVTEYDSAESQASNFARTVGDTSIPVMLDVELQSGGIDVYWNVVRAFNDLGYEVDLTYLPHWYWQGHIGSPDLSGVPGLVSSSYVGYGGYASDVYPGPGWSGWSSYGGASPVLCQFTEQCQVAGQRVDCMAFEGDLGALDKLFRVESEDSVNTGQVDQIVDRVTANVTNYMWPVVSDTKDNREQLVGGRDLKFHDGGGVDVAKSYPGWDQLGGRTLVDALAAIGAELGIEGFGK